MDVPPGDTWLAIGAESLDDVGRVYSWCVRDDCGAVVLFSGTVRDHAEGREGVDRLEYEAYTEQVVPRLGAIADEMRRRWPDVGRIALLHRVGVLELGAASVLVAVSAPHRAEAFDAARYGIDTLKATVPIWKREHWADGVGWGHDATTITDVG